MKIRVVSDLHLDCCPMRARAPVGASLALVPGDTVNGREAAEIPGLLEQLFPEERILTVMGNHEGYRLRDFEAMCDMVERACEGTRVTALRRSCAEVGGIAFLGATLWTDFALFGERRLDDSMAAAQAAMMDYRVIHQDGRVVTAQDTLAWHRRDLAWLRSELASRHARGQRCAVLTHHAPSRGSLARRYAMDASSAGFVSDLPESDFLIPELWAHGHTHTGFDYLVGRCRVVCNPRGYTTDMDLSTENPAFSPDFVVELADPA